MTAPAKLCADCKEVEVFAPFTFCPVCSKARRKARADRFNAAKSAERKCRCGCGKPAGKGSKYHPECSVAIGKEKKALANGRAVKALAEKPAQTRHKSTKIVKTSLQVDKECRQEERRLAEVRAKLDPQLLALRACRGAAFIVGV